ncbi:type I methionyl aminopeptidase [Sulfitobacter guttiformis]|uniref:Methionine aminopeptidase n=1 Tax=Sulfitobacter guttiformis TaxID=74349 RepID=A0A420DHH8_9RHOB|nr:type I methionyl aminopeptidase [Sulfitobacter guttiformis]KIN72572.1 Methionine aminopeptidase [Sulfitobacter guttiformis KCTC 32187]RKE93683.1 methionine aminopeptidase type I [Sulfitobacter guttiformis]
MDRYECIDILTAPEAEHARRTESIKLYGPDAFEGMRRAGELTARCLDDIADLICAGTALSQINNFVLNFAAKYHATPATLGYKSYPYACCTSVNHVVCHGFPDEKKLRDGDIVNVDVTLILNGWHGDSSRMYVVGKPKRTAERLIQIAHEAMMQGISVVRPGARLGDIGNAIQTYARSERCSVVREFCGHGIGQVFHDSPDILNFGTAGTGLELREGMIFTIEPMINLGRADVKLLADEWTAVTRDRSLSAQFEHSIGVTSDGFEIFTRSPTGLHAPGIKLFTVPA